MVKQFPQLQTSGWPLALRNMVAPRPQAPPGSSKLQTLQTPSVAAELLVSSALRMLWPADAWAKRDARDGCAKQMTNDRVRGMEVEFP